MRDAEGPESPARRERFGELVRASVEALGGSSSEVATLPVSDGELEEVDTAFEELEAIHERRHRYDLSWAFRNAQASFDAIYRAVEQRLAEHLEERGDADESPRHVGRRGLRLVAWAARVFSVLSVLVSLVDIVISVALILVISKISHYTDSLIGSAVVALAVVGVVALIKVTLDRFVIIPMVHRWGWRKYASALERNKHIFSTLFAVYVVKRGLGEDGGEQELEALRRRSMVRLRAALRRRNGMK